MIVAFVPNIFDRGRFGGQVTFVDSAADAAALNPTVILVDLDRCEELTGFRLNVIDRAITVVGFGSHVDAERHRAAHDAGYDRVLARSVFFRQLPKLLTTGHLADEPIGDDHES